MLSRTLCLVLVAAVVPVILPPNAFAGQESTITFESLLREMTDRTAIARWPAAEYRMGQFSSWDRRTAQGDLENPRPSPDMSDEGWFANADYGKYLRTEERNGRTEKVLMDAQGPGAIVRIWSANPMLGGTLRVYLDGSDEPVIEENFEKLTNGSGPVASPLSAQRSRGHNLYLPIPYAKRCLVTLDGDPGNRVYYIINYREFAEGAQIQSFAKGDLDRHRTLIDEGQQQLGRWPDVVRWPGLVGQSTGSMASPLAPGDSVEAELEEGPAAVYELSVTVSLDGPEAADALSRSLVLEGFADGERRIHAPLGDFFGSGVGFNSYQGWYRKVEVADGEATLTSRWVMPFRESMRFRVTNHGDQHVELSISADAGKWQWDENSMYFHANFRQQRDIPTQPRQDFNYLTVEGQGVFVGDTLAVANPTPVWWGEGDEKVYIDGEEFPSHVGTGTEDYYGYAWCWPDLFKAPFHAQPRCDGPDNFGHTTNTRVRSLDAIPFNNRFQLDMEIWHWQDVKVSYAVTTYWYARPGARAVGPAAEEEMDLAIPTLPEMHRLEGVAEAETLEIAGKSDEFPVGQQMMFGAFEGQWSNGKHLWIRATEAGQWVDLKLPAIPAGRRTLTAWLTRAPDYGIVQLHINGKPVGEPIDLHAAKVEPTGPIEVGTFEAADGSLTLRIELVGSHPRATGAKHFVGLDAVKVD